MNNLHKRNTIYVSFATPDYKSRMLQMADSLLFHGIPAFRIDLHTASITGNWKERVKAKVEFMRIMCYEHEFHNVCWIDADARVVRHPKWFEEFDGEWGMAREPRRQGRSAFHNCFLSNAYIVKPCSKSESLLMHWQHHTRNVKSRTPTQTAFNEVYAIYQKELQLDFREVPLSYCWYEPHKNKAPYCDIEPVIVHDIASRGTIARERQGGGCVES